jgi:two-component system chemotaxis response regulator CheY
MRKLVATMLLGMGFTNVIEAKDGAEGWKRLTQHDVDVVLTDWNMPIMDGIELVEKIRRAPDFQDLPILLFTARTTKEDVLHALKAGIDTYITKPFTQQQLHTKIQTVLLKRSRQQVNDILRYQDEVDREDDFPIIIFGESDTTADQLSQSQNKIVINFLANTTAAVRNVDERTPDYHIG